MGSISVRPTACLEATPMAEIPAPVTEVAAEGVLTAPATTVTSEVTEAVTAPTSSGGELAEGVVTTTAPPVGEKVEKSPAPPLTPGTPRPHSVAEIAASDPDEGEIEIVPAKRHKLHREIRVLAQ